MIKLINQFAQSVASGEIEIYNEISLQHELGIILRKSFPTYKVQFERNVTYFGFSKGNFIKKELDISVFSPDRDNFEYAIELKFPRNGQHPEQMYSFCKDIVFIEQLKQAGFQRTFLIIFADDPLFYISGSKRDGIFGYFREGKILHGTVRKPTGKENKEVVINGKYTMQWNTVQLKTNTNELKYAIIEANNNCS